MKKILILLFFFNLFFINLSSSEITECKEFSKLTAKYYKCKKNKFVKNTKDYQKKEWGKEKNEWIKEKEKLKSIKDKILKK